MASNNYKKVVIELLSKAEITIDGPNNWDIHVKNEGFYQSVLSKASLGLGESYMDGWWECKNVDEFIFRLVQADYAELKTFGTAFHYLKAKVFNLQTRKGAKKVVNEHYDLKPELFMSFLDPYNQYTCGYFKNTDDLNVAQEQKLRLICEKLELKPTDTVLDIGCGWGGFAKFSSTNYGCKVRGITISQEQAEYAREFTKGLPVEIAVEDYRDLTGEYDKILVCGMIEHVGYKNYQALFKIIQSHLKNNGLFLLHTIGYFKSVKGGDPWLSKYIFPNGMLPSIKQMAQCAENFFIVEDLQNFGAYYDKTLLAWMQNFDKHWEILKNDYDERFYRMWKYYLLSCAGIFRARKAQLYQFVFSKEGVPGGYMAPR